jgi:hypothetical protein
MNNPNDESYIKPFEQVLDAIINHTYNTTDPIFYYVAIGSANHRNDFPKPIDRHEYPDYVANLPYKRKVLILIDPSTRIPLSGSGYDIHCVINHNSNPNINPNLNSFDKYESLELDEMGKSKLEIYTIRNIIYLDSNAYHQDKIEYVRFGKKFLIDLVSYALITHPKSLLMVSNYTGHNWYHLQDEFINMFDPEIQFDIRKRFLIDSRYYNDLGCYYNLVDRINQPIIEDGYFFNPGLMSSVEFNEIVRKITIDDKMMAGLDPSTNYEKIYVHNQKKMYMLDLFSSYIKLHLNESYRTKRMLCNETKDENEKIKIRIGMLGHVKEVLKYVGDFVNVENFIGPLKNGSIYADEFELKKLINSIIKVDHNILNYKQPDNNQDNLNNKTMDV